MNQHHTNPITDDTGKQEASEKAMLRSAYLVFIRAYLRYKNVESREVKHGEA